MTVTALVSGGKDSVYAAYLADTQGRTVDELVVLRPSDPESMMFHTPNLDLVALQAEAWGKSYRSVEVAGADEGAELAALEQAIEGGTGWVVAGAIASSYQWSRLLAVAGRVGRPVYTPLWRKDPARVVQEEISAGLDIRLVHLAAEPLSEELLGRRLDSEMLREIEFRSARLRRTNVAGEGGEYESLVVDAPFFRSRIELDRVERRVEGSTSRLRVHDAHLAPKRGTAGP
ncbi:MAG TPA: diphthine--ammonia ligase [Thermoplasmata archaeon]|nr:diphthine--ammonia ligase [Thermoplasmata archaeon]